MKRKIIATLLMLLCLVSFVGCKGKDTDTKPDDNKKPTQEENSEDTTDKEDPKEEPKGEKGTSTNPGEVGETIKAKFVLVVNNGTIPDQSDTDIVDVKCTMNYDARGTIGEQLGKDHPFYAGYFPAGTEETSDFHEAKITVEIPEGFKGESAILSLKGEVLDTSLNPLQIDGRTLQSRYLGNGIVVSKPGQPNSVEFLCEVPKGTSEYILKFKTLNNDEMYFKITK